MNKRRKGEGKNKERERLEIRVKERRERESLEKAWKSGKRRGRENEGTREITLSPTLTRGSYESRGGRNPDYCSPDYNITRTDRSTHITGDSLEIGIRERRENNGRRRCKERRIDCWRASESHISFERFLDDFQRIFEFLEIIDLEEREFVALENLFFFLEEILKEWDQRMRIIR